MLNQDWLKSVKINYWRSAKLIMAGHSHWAALNTKKEEQTKKGQRFSKLSREITVAAKLGDKDPSINPRPDQLSKQQNKLTCKRKYFKSYK